ncbi:predicted protein [Arabidopsis lyrata subsp. lyrata]|uniref:Predicted protein n=1 Tax=Arabidopsis lyrata subsp. lyrata TaxID=81972 RepID=D7MPS3_ARALL|nr:predicted protein [Arabidopsis lyrata subsp. lyrata]
MENDQQGPCLRDEDKEKMEQVIKNMLILCADKSTAIHLLMQFGWKPRLVAVQLGGRREELLAESEYLKKNFYSLEENLTVISCPDQDCGASVGPKTIDRLGVRDQEMYGNYILRSYLESKQLPAPDSN